MALIIRLVQQRFCHHQWITVWIGRDAVYDLCLFCRKWIIDPEGEYERLPSRGATGIARMCDNNGDRPERQQRIGLGERNLRPTANSHAVRLRLTSR